MCFFRVFICFFYLFCIKIVFFDLFFLSVFVFKSYFLAVFSCLSDFLACFLVLFSCFFVLKSCFSLIITPFQGFWGYYFYHRASPCAGLLCPFRVLKKTAGQSQPPPSFIFSPIFQRALFLTAVGAIGKNSLFKTYLYFYK